MRELIDLGLTIQKLFLMLINFNATRSDDLSMVLNLRHQTHRKLTQCLRIQVLERVCGDHGNIISQPRRCCNDGIHQLIFILNIEQNLSSIHASKALQDLDDSCLSEAMPRQSKHQGVELNAGDL